MISERRKLLTAEHIKPINGNCVYDEHNTLLRCSVYIIGSGKGRGKGAGNGEGGHNTLEDNPELIPFECFVDGVHS